MVPELLNCTKCGSAALVLSWSPIPDDATEQAALDDSRTVFVFCRLDCPRCGPRIQNARPGHSHDRALSLYGVNNPMLRLPLWFVPDRNGNAPGDEPADMLAFSTHEKLTAYLQQSRTSANEVVPASAREQLVAVIADIHMRGGDAVYLDPDSDGHGGKCVFLTELLMIE